MTVDVVMALFVTRSRRPAATSVRSRRRVLTAVTVALAVAMASAAVAVPAASGPAFAAASLPAGTSSFVPVGPLRLVDTRASGTPLAGGTSIVIQVAGPGGPAGVPSDATAAAINVAATETSGPGFFTVWGDGPRPLSSSLNVDAARQTRANFSISPIAANGTITVFTMASAHIIVDLSGVFVPATSATNGRMITLGPTRALDTRVTDTPLAPGEERAVSLAAAGVPASASAVVVALTAVGPVGWWSAYPPGSVWPGTSVVNVDTPANPATALAITPAANSEIVVKSMAGGHLIVDVSGYITGAGASSGTDGLFVPITPTRILDTRDSQGFRLRISPGTAREPRWYPYPLAAAGAIASNITVVEPTAPGFMTAYPTATDRPFVAAANYAARQTLATFAITPGSTRGISLFSLAETDVVVDTTGYFLGAPTPVPADTRYRLALGYDDGYSMWDPCTVIDVRVNYDTAPPGTRDVIANVFGQLSLATGLQFTISDTTEQRLDTTIVSPMMLIRFRSPAEYTGFETGAWAFAHPMSFLYQGAHIYHYTDIVIRNDMGFLANVGGDRSLGTILLHELGHSVGLDHYQDSSQVIQVMNPGYLPFEQYQSGDLAGLAAISSDVCLPRPPPGWTPESDQGPPT